jgi:hypothetical protein
MADLAGGRRYRALRPRRRLIARRGHLTAACSREAFRDDLMAGGCHLGDVLQSPIRPLTI